MSKSSKEMSDQKCSCGCGNLLPFMWAASGKKYLRSHSPHAGKAKVSKVQSNSTAIQLPASTTSIPLMIKFAKEGLALANKEVDKWITVLAALEDVNKA